MKPQPKGGSITAHDAAFFGRDSVTGPFCLLCGAPFPDGHHEPPRGRVPKAWQKEIPRFSLCGPGNTAGTCHGMAHRNGGTVRIDLTESGYVFVLDARAELQVNVRRARRGLPPILHTYEIQRGGTAHVCQD